MGSENKHDLMVRTKQFALRIIRMYTALPKNSIAQVLGRQVLRSGTSVGAHYREGHRARSTAEFSQYKNWMKLKYWLELIVEAKLVRATQLVPLQTEANELSAILTASVKTAKRRKE